jgi:hypothetical protein
MVVIKKMKRYISGGVCVCVCAVKQKKEGSALTCLSARIYQLTIRHIDYAFLLHLGYVPKY